jgi:RNA polymerase-binding transcription factor DksA
VAVVAASGLCLGFLSVRSIAEVDKKSLRQTRQALLALKRMLSNNIDHLQNDALKTAGDTVDELSDVPAEHMADRGSDNFMRDLKISVLQNTDAELCDVNLALDKIEDGTYGSCEHCSGKIAMKRLKALPFARLCMSCQQEEERHGARD